MKLRKPLCGLTSFAGRTLAVAIVATGMSSTFASAQTMMTDGSLVIRDFVLARGVNDREPVGVTKNFSRHDERGYAHVRIDNDGTATRLTFVWEIDGAEHARIPLQIGKSPAWRTWTSVNLRPGEWTVKLVNETGMVLAENKFTVGNDQSSTDTKDWDGVPSAAGDFKPASGPYSDD